MSRQIRDKRVAEFNEKLRGLVKFYITDRNPGVDQFARRFLISCKDQVLNWDNMSDGQRETLLLIWESYGINRN